MSAVESRYREFKPVDALRVISFWPVLRLLILKGFEPVLKQPLLPDLDVRLKF